MKCDRLWKAVAGVLSVWAVAASLNTVLSAPRHREILTRKEADLEKIRVPTLVLHGDSDATVPFEGSGRRTHEAIEGSRLTVLKDAPHGCNLSHADEFNRALLAFLAA